MIRPPSYNPGEWHPNSTDASLIIRALIRISEQLEEISEALEARNE